MCPRSLVPFLLLVPAVAAAAHAEEKKTTAEEESRAVLSADVRIAWPAARALVQRPASQSRAVCSALAGAIGETKLTIEIPKALRRSARSALIDRIRQSALLARLARREIAVPVGMVAVSGGLARRPLTGEEVVVGDFFLERLEVSRAQIAAFLAARRHCAEGEGFLEGWSAGKPPAGTESLAATHLSRVDASAYAAWRKRRLPTAEEWTIARGGCGLTTFPWGTRGKAGRSNIIDGKGSRRPEPVEGRPEGATPLGVLRLAGNVSEWTSSPWGPRKDTGVVAGESFLSVLGFRTELLRKTRVEVRRRDLGLRCAASIPGP